VYVVVAELADALALVIVSIVSFTAETAVGLMLGEIREAELAVALALAVVIVSTVSFTAEAAVGLMIGAIREVAAAAALGAIRA
jgi:hypothetical protein